MSNIIQAFPKGNGTNLDIIADEFDDTKSYAVNDRCYKDGSLYKCTTAHTGAWVAGDFVEVTLDDVIPKPLTAAQMADVKSGFAPTNVVGVEFGGHVYNPNEHVVGKWQQMVDGVLKEKPVYEKSYTNSFGTVTEGTFSWIELDTLENIDNIIKLDGAGKHGVTWSPRGNLRDDLSRVKWDVQLNFQTHKLWGYSASAGASDMPFTVSIQYTKTTDEWKTVS